MVIPYIIFLLAGFVTGIVTGLVGASAIVVFVPIILIFLNYSLFALIGVSLAVDVFVSLLAMIIYRRFHHIDFRTGLYLSIPAIVGAVVGSYLGKIHSCTYSSFFCGSTWRRTWCCRRNCNFLASHILFEF